MPMESTVFVIDDDIAVRESLRLSLKLAGYAVELFESATAFLASDALGRHGCVVTDIRMPDMDGLALQAELVKRNSHLPVVIITGHGDIPMTVRAMRAGAVDFLEKPFARETLLASVARALEIGNRTAETAHNTHEILARIATLTPREREVFALVVDGKQSKVIAYELGASARTIEVHRGRVMDKLQAKSLQELVRMAIAAGVISG